MPKDWFKRATSSDRHQRQRAAEGEVYNLQNLADPRGEFSAVTAGVTIIEGRSLTYIRNDKRVVIKLHSQTGGLSLRYPRKSRYFA